MIAFLFPKSDDQNSCDKPKYFQTYFIFVTWASTAKPTSDMASAILPFKLNQAIKPLTYFLDNGPLFLATAWKQSLNATGTALGAGFPDAYLHKSWRLEGFGTESRYFEDEHFGRDLPLSAMIYKLVKCKIAPKAIDSRDPLKCAYPELGAATYNLHLVGHTYGAKLVAFAGMEALRRWVLVNKMDLPDLKEEGAEKFKKKIYQKM